MKTLFVCADCAAVRDEFSAYLDGEMNGVSMQAMAAHLEACTGCAMEFEGLRDMQAMLGSMRTAQEPAGLQARLRAVIGVERERGTHLPLTQRVAKVWAATWAPLAMRVVAGAVVAVGLVGGVVLMLGAPDAVQANDEPLGAMTTPHYLYSQVPPQPIELGENAPEGVPILVEAEIDGEGRVFDYRIIAGPADAKVARRIEANLLGSVFQPATVFGVPVNGRVMMTYTGVSVRG